MTSICKNQEPQKKMVKKNQAIKAKYSDRENVEKLKYNI